MNKVYQQCRYLLSAHNLRQLPSDSVMEVAFAGRSNAGKSSAINRICGQKSLAKTSRTPGRTQAINLFSIGGNKHLVDLPGYGYAKVSTETRQQWNHLLAEYIHSRKVLRALMLIMDIRHPLQTQDWILIDLAQNSRLSLHVLLTKCDKLTRNQQHKVLHTVLMELENNSVDATLQLFSARDGTGVGDAHTVLDDWFSSNRPM